MSTGATPFEDSPYNSVEAWTQEALSVVPTPEGVNSRELVLQAIEMRGPARLPFSFVEPLQSDFFELCELERRLNPHRKLPMGESYTDVWQVDHEVAKGLFDRVVEHPLRDLSDLSDYEFPAVDELVDLNTLRPFVQRACGVGKYIVAADPVLLFERLRSLMGFESMILAPRKQAARFSDLLDSLAELTVKSVESLGRLEGVDSFMSWQDFGAQSGLMIRVEEFRELYKPGLARVVCATHEQGLRFVLHSCGELRELIPDFIEIGVDVLQLDQAKLLGYEFLSFTNCFNGSLSLLTVQSFKLHFA